VHDGYAAALAVNGAGIRCGIWIGWPGESICLLPLTPNIGKTLFKIGNQVLTRAGNMKRFCLAAFRADPSRQLLGRSLDEAALASDRHTRFLPALSNCRGLTQEFCDLSPAFQERVFRLGFCFRHACPDLRYQFLRRSAIGDPVFLA
jgi:hypothetical protein